MTRVLLPAIVLAVAFGGCTPKPAPPPVSVAPSAASASAADIAYCNQLASLYERYGSPQDRRGEDFGSSVAEAVNQCNSGNPDGGIAALSRLLMNQDITLPPRPKS